MPPSEKSFILRFRSRGVLVFHDQCPTYSDVIEIAQKTFSSLQRTPGEDIVILGNDTNCPWFGNVELSEGAWKSVCSQLAYVTVTFKKERERLEREQHEKEDSLQKNYESVADAESPGPPEYESHYIFAVKTTAPEFDIVDCCPSDLWMIKNEGMRLSMVDSGMYGSILFQKRTTRERFAVTLGVHRSAPWGGLATNLGGETLQEINDLYERNVPNGLRYTSKPLMAGRTVDVILVEEVDKKKRFHTEIIVK